MTNFRRVVLPIDATIADAISIIDKEPQRIVLATDKNDHLKGTVTDGDIRRGLLKGSQLSSFIEDVMNKTPVTVPSSTNISDIGALMKSLGLRQMPIIDSDGKLAGLETLQELESIQVYDNTVFIMAGGFGKRLHPLTVDTPKPLLKIGKKPILEIIIDRLIADGFRKFVISVHYKSEMIRNYFGNGERWGIKISYIEESTPLGTAGALSLLDPELRKLPILVTNADLLTAVNYSELLSFHNQSNGNATICVREYSHQVPFGVIENIEQKVINIVEKPVQNFFVNAGVYVIDNIVLDKLQKNKHCDMPDLLKSVLDDDFQVSMFPIFENWLDIGRHSDFELAQEYAKDK